MQNYRKNEEQLFDELNSDEHGLDPEQYATNFAKYGENKLVEGKQKSVAIIFLEQFRDLMVVILIAAAIVSAMLGDIESMVVILAVITMNAVLGTIQTVKAEKSLSSLKSLSVPTAKVRRAGEICVVPSDQVTVGDILVLDAGDFVCADGRIIKNASLKINESVLTGESTEVEKARCEILTEKPLAERSNMVYSGSFVTYGRAEVLVTEIGMSTETGKIAQLLKSAKNRKTPLQESLDNFGKKLSIIIMVICALVFGLSVLRGEELMNAFLFAVALAVAAIPEALSSIVTIVLSFGTKKISRENAIIRKLQAVEGLGSVSVICSDKTGTLTQNKMTVRKAYINGRLIDCEGGLSTEDNQLEILLQAAILCNDSCCEGCQEIGDPTEIALVKLAQKSGLDVGLIRNRFERVSELPFDSDRKLMSTANKADCGITMQTKGAIDVLLERVVLSEEEKKEILSVAEKLSAKGLRLLAFARKQVDTAEISVDDEKDLRFIGLLAMADPPRPESKNAVAECKRAGIKPVMITGDHKITAAAIAKEIGILDDISDAVEGAEIDTLDDKALTGFVTNKSVYARVSPEHKIRIVRAWQESGHIVAMTGDGVNDAPALKQADIGVAMGITGTEVSKDAASVVLLDDNFATIVKAINNGRNIYLNIQRAIRFLLSGNTAAILVVLFASVCGLPVPFAAVHLLFINLLTDSLPAIALGLEPHSNDVMDSLPRPKNEPILTKKLMLSIVTESVIIAVAALVCFLSVLESSAATASTMAFASICLSRLLHSFNCKSELPVLFSKKMFNNKMLLGAVGIGLVLLATVLFVPAIGSAFKVEPLVLKQVFLICGTSLGSLGLIQAVKAIKKRFHK